MKEFHKIHSIYKRDEKNQFTDEFSLPEFKYLSGLEWKGYEKVDGTNIRIHYDPAINPHRPFKIGGRTKDAQLSIDFVDALHDTMFEKLDILMEIFQNAKKSPFTLYGEGVGPGINSNRFNTDFKKYEFILFDVLVGNWWLEDPAIDDISEKLGLRRSPMIEEYTFSEAIDFVKTHPKSILGKTQDMEGLILKPKVQLFNRKGERIMTKVKVNDFK